MPELNPYEAPQEVNQPEQPATKASRNKEISGITIAFLFQLVALVFTLINWVASELSPWGNDIQRHAWYAVSAGTIAGVLGLGILVAAQRQQKSGWVLFEVLVIGFLILSAVARLT